MHDLTARVEVPKNDFGLFEVGATINVELAWKSGLDATAQWRVCRKHIYCLGSEYIHEVTVVRPKMPTARHAANDFHIAEASGDIS
jgi:hypothetical protein